MKNIETMKEYDMTARILKACGKYNMQEAAHFIENHDASTKHHWTKCIPEFRNDSGFCKIFYKIRSVQFHVGTGFYTDLDLDSVTSIAGALYALTVVSNQEDITAQMLYARGGTGVERVSHGGFDSEGINNQPTCYMKLTLSTTTGDILEEKANLPINKKDIFKRTHNTVCYGGGGASTTFV